MTKGGGLVFQFNGPREKAAIAPGGKKGASERKLYAPSQVAAHEHIGDFSHPSYDHAMDRLYAPGEIVRWEPSTDIPESPLSAFDLTWSADRTLECRGHYGHNSTEGRKGIIVRFEDVHAFASFDGFSDTLLSYRDHLPPLKKSVPYGGCWPFVEIRDSRWVKDIADEHCSLGDQHRYTHWSILTFDQTLHVMAPSDPQPQVMGWLE